MEASVEKAILTSYKLGSTWLTELCPDQGIEEIFNKDNTSGMSLRKFSSCDAVDGYDYGSVRRKKHNNQLTVPLCRGF